MKNALEFIEKISRKLNELNEDKNKIIKSLNHFDERIREAEDEIKLLEKQIQNEKDKITNRTHLTKEFIIKTILGAPIISIIASIFFPLLMLFAGAPLIQVILLSISAFIGNIVGAILRIRSEKKKLRAFSIADIQKNITELESKKSANSLCVAILKDKWYKLYDELLAKNNEVLKVNDEIESFKSSISSLHEKKPILETKVVLEKKLGTQQCSS